MCDFCYGTELRAQLVGRASYIMYVCVARVCMCVGIDCMHAESLINAHTMTHTYTLTLSTQHWDLSYDRIHESTLVDSWGLDVHSCGCGTS